MRDEFREKIEALLDQKIYDWQIKVIDAIMAEYEFKCESFVYAGPGHQSRHDCENQRPHPLNGEHYDNLYNWVGTARFEILADLCLVCHGTGEHAWVGSTTTHKCHSCDGTGHRRKLINTHHEGYNCTCRIPEGVRYSG